MDLSGSPNSLLPLGVFFGPLHLNKGGKAVVEAIIDILASVKIRPEEVRRLSISPSKGYASLQLVNNYLEKKILRALTNPRSTIRPEILRIITPRPLQFRVSKFFDCARLTMHRPGPSKAWNGKPKSAATSGNAGNAGNAGKRSPTITRTVSPKRPEPKPKEEKEQKEKQEKEEKQDKEQEKEEKQDKEQEKQEKRQRAQKVLQEEEEQKQQEQAHSSKVQKKKGPSSLASGSSKSSKRSAKQASDGRRLVNAKTSTPKMPPCTCPETVFYRRLQHIGTEARYSEFKRTGFLGDPREFTNLIGRYTCGFLNSGGGTLYLGVNDDGRVQGVDLGTKPPAKTMEVIVNAIKSISPEVAPEEYSVNFAKVKDVDGHEPIANLFVIEICVFPRISAAIPVFSFKDMKFLRRDGSLQKLKRSRAT